MKASMPTAQVMLRQACPYEPGTAEYRDWTRGWDEAEEADFEEICG